MEVHTEFSPILFRARYQHVIEAPEEFVRGVQSSLSRLRGPGHDDKALEECSSFLRALNHLPKTEDYSNLMHGLIYYGLLTAYIRSVLNGHHWIHEPGPTADDTVYGNFKLLSRLLVDIAHLARYAMVGGPSTKNLLLQEMERISRFMQIMWDHSPCFYENPSIPETQINVVLRSILLCTLRLEALCAHWGLSLLTPGPEPGALVFFCWSNMKKDSYGSDLDELFLMTVSGGFNSSTFKRSWEVALETAMVNTDDAALILETCTRLLRSNIIDDSLYQLLSIASHPHRLCPSDTKEEIASSVWLRLLDSLTRACERQLCTGNEDVAYRNVLPWAITVFCDMLSSTEYLSAKFTRNLMTFDIIPLLARYSVYLATRGSDDLAKSTEGLIRAHQSLAATLRDEDKFYTLSSLIRTARIHVPGVVSRLREVVETSSAATLRKTTLCVAWMRYYRALGLELGTTVVTEPGLERIMTRDKACSLKSCLCFGRKPSHKLSICKGCRRVYYCNPRCQKKDWHEGGHADVCRKTNP